MRNLILAGAAALAFSAPAAAQDMDADVEADVMADVTLTADQRAMYDSWPMDRRTMYDAWPNEAQVYYWTLTPEQTEGWWVLNDDQRLRIVRMTPAQRTAAWTSVAAQMNGAARAMPVSAGASANMRFVSNAMVQPIPEDSPPVSGDDLPVCTPNQQDGCINSWEKNRTGTRPLNYWPGKPASEIDTPLPAEDPND